MFGWSIIERACRSISNRAITSRVSIPNLMTLTAARSVTGAVCSAKYTTPMPPSPMRSPIRNRPRVVPVRLGMSVAPSAASGPASSCASARS